MFKCESSSDFKAIFENPSISYPRNPVPLFRRPFPSLRRRVMANRYSNVGFRPLMPPPLRANCPTMHGKLCERYSTPPQCAFRPPPPVLERLPFLNRPPNNSFETQNQQYPFVRAIVINYSNTQTPVESFEKKPQSDELNSFSDLWMEALAPNGRKYYYNARTRFTTWDTPTQAKIIGLQEINRLQNCYKLENPHNSPTGSLNPFIPQPCNPPITVFNPRNIPTSPRFMLPPPQNVCHYQTFPENVQRTPSYQMNPTATPEVPPFPTISEFQSSSNEEIDKNMNATSTERSIDSVETFSSQNSNNVISNDETNISVCSVSSNNLPLCNHNEVDVSKEQNDTFHDLNVQDEELKPEELPGKKVDCSDGGTSGEPIEKSCKQLTKPTKEMQPLSEMHVPGTNWSIVSTKDEKIYYYNSQLKLSVWEKPVELKEIDIKEEDVKEFHKNRCESSYSKSEQDIQDSKLEELATREFECSASEKLVESKKELPVDKTRPVSSTPVYGTPWFVVWTGDQRVFYYDPHRKISIWERPLELLNRFDVDKLIEKPPSEDLKSPKKEARKMETDDSDINKKLKKENVNEDNDCDTTNKKLKKDDSDCDETNEKLKKENAKDNTDASPNIENRNDESDDKPKSDDIPHEEKVKIFYEMLEEKKISAFSSWEKELHKIVFDTRYLLLSSKERRQVFESFILKKMDEEKKERQMELHLKKINFISLLKEAGLDSRSRFHEFAQKYGKDARFKSLERMRIKESLFNQYVYDLIKEEREQAKIKAERKKNFLQLLKEQKYFTPEVSWVKVRENISDDERYKAVSSNTEREEIFNEYIKKLYSNEDDRVSESIRNRKEQVKRNLSVHLKDRERERETHKNMSATSDFNALLNDLISKSDISWHSAKKILKKDHRWGLAQTLKPENLENLFDRHIDALKCKTREEFHHMLDELPDVTFQTSWLDIRKTALADSRCSKFSSSERKCEKEFKDYLRLKHVYAKKDFKHLLRETKAITYKSKSLLSNTNHLKDIEAILSQDKRYLNLDSLRSERKEILLAYIDQLHEEGPPPPPTASEPSRRHKREITNFDNKI